MKTCWNKTGTASFTLCCMYSPLNPLVKARLIQQKVENWKSVCAPCTHCVRLLVPWWTVAHQAPLPMEFSRRKYWSGLPFPIPGCLPDPGIQPAPLESPELAGGFFSSAPPGKRNWKDGMLFALEKCFVLGFCFVVHTLRMNSGIVGH